MRHRERVPCGTRARMPGGPQRPPVGSIPPDLLRWPRPLEDMEILKTPERYNALSAIATTVGGLLAVCWQLGSGRGPRRAFVLVGVTGIEPVTSAV